MRPRATIPPDSDERQADRDAVDGGRRARSDDRRRDDLGRPARGASRDRAEHHGIELQGAELAAEVARLRARLRPTDQPQEPARNLFQFNARTARSSAAPPLTENAVPVAAVPPPPPLSLIGFAAEGATRTAIISGFGDLFLVKEGDRIGAQFRVARIDADGVVVTNTSDETTFTIRLQQ